MKSANRLLGLTKRMLEENGLVKAPGTEKDIHADKMSIPGNAKKNPVTGSGKKGYEMEHDLDDTADEFNAGCEFNDDCE